MAGRQVFSESEKACLKELIIKYKLNTTGTIGAGNPNFKKIAWARLTEEYNSIESNNKRTEAQLKKCWDNLKTRRKQVLALEKRERMKTGGGAFIPTHNSQDIDVVFQDPTDVELRFVCDSDSVLDASQAVEVVDEIIVQDFLHLDQAAGESPQQESIGQELERSVESPRQQPESQLTDHDALVIQGQGQSVESPRRLESQLTDHCAQAVQGQSVESPRRLESQLTDHCARAVQGQSVETPRRRPESQLTDHSALASQRQGATNVRARVITEEFTIRKEQYDQSQRRDEELHKLKVAEQEWLTKAAQEKYHKARLERECAEELLRFNQLQREEAELRLQIFKNKK